MFDGDSPFILNKLANPKTLVVVRRNFYKSVFKTFLKYNSGVEDYQPEPE